MSLTTRERGQEEEGGYGGGGVVPPGLVDGGGVRSSRARVNARIRTANGGWEKVFDTYCGIVGGAALTPGVDVFGIPAEVGCAGYGAYRAVEAIVEAL